jgi:hypothetical protein
MWRSQECILLWNEVTEMGMQKILILHTKHPCSFNASLLGSNWTLWGFKRGFIKLMAVLQDPFWNLVAGARVCNIPNNVMWNPGHIDNSRNEFYWTNLAQIKTKYSEKFHLTTHIPKDIHINLHVHKTWTQFPAIPGGAYKVCRAHADEHSLRKKMIEGYGSFDLFSYTKSLTPNPIFSCYRYDQGDERKTLSLPNIFASSL